MVRVKQSASEFLAGMGTSADRQMLNVREVYFVGAKRSFVYGMVNIPLHWKENVTLTKFSSLEGPKVIILIASDENFIKTTALFQCMD